MKTANNEKDIQNFIAKYPWLLDLKYENVPELDKNGLEYYIEGNKRTDLILRDNVTKCPVVIEFKYWDLKREDVGQILEYKARIFTSFNDENSELFRIFGNKLYSPKLVLVVRESDDYGRMACSLQNIELFEFGNMEKRIIEDIPFIKRVKDFSDSLKEHSPPITEDRNEYLQNNVYSIIENLFEKHGILEKWKYYRNANLGEWYNYKNIFLNRNILPDESVNMGIYEDILKDKDMCVCIAYYTWLDSSDEINETKKKLNKLEKLLKTNSNLTEDIKIDITTDEENKYEYWLVQKYKYATFFENVEKIMEFNISNYLKVFGI
jgi:hypothetical protein